VGAAGTEPVRDGDGPAGHLGIRAPLSGQPGDVRLLRREFVSGDLFPTKPPPDSTTKRVPSWPGSFDGWPTTGGLAILVIEHDVSLVLDISDRVGVLDFGVKIAEGPPHESARDASVVASCLGTDHKCRGPLAAGNSDRCPAG
jgi:hypothetical protein